MTTPMADVWCDNGNVYVAPYPSEIYSVQPLLKAVPSMRFLPNQGYWYAPATQASVFTLFSSFPARYHESVNPFLAEHERLADSQRLKFAQDLVPPDSKTKPWLHQTQAFRFLENLPAGGLFADMGCLGGDTNIDLHLERRHTGYSRNVIISIGQLHALAYNEENSPDFKLARMIMTANGLTYSQINWTNVKIRAYLPDTNKFKRVRLLALTRKPLPQPTVKVMVNNRPDPIVMTLDHEVWCKHQKTWEWLPISKIQAGATVIIKENSYEKPVESFIMDIEPHTEQTVYDISTEEPNNFLASGLVVHNCGKTKITIDLLADWKPRRSLVVCPKRVVNHWPRQMKTHSVSPQTVVPLTGSIQERVDLMRIAPSSNVLFVTNYESFQYEPFRDKVENLNLDFVGLDESHRIKAPGGKISQFFAKLGRRTPRRMCLTGTPSADKPLDIYGQYRFLDPTIFGTRYETFKNRYAVFGGFEGRQILEYINQDDLHDRMYTIAFRVTDDVLDLPEVQDINIDVTLSPKANKIYRTMKKDKVVTIGNGVMAAENSLAKLTRLAQITSGYLPLTDMTTDETYMEVFDESKYEAVNDLLDDLPEEEPLVFFARFRPDLDRLRKLLESRGRTVMELSGKKDEWEKWQYDCTGNEILIAQIAAGGSGVELFRSRYAIYFSVDFSLTNFSQARKRIHRPGQTRPVVNYYLVAGLDQYIIAALLAKKDVSDYVTDILELDYE